MFALELAVWWGVAAYAPPTSAVRLTTFAMVYSMVLGAVYLSARRLGYEQARRRLTAKGASVVAFGGIALIGGVGFVFSFFEPTCRDSRISFGILFIGHVGVLALGAALLRGKPERGKIRDSTGP
mgnify:CR=1 FL=1